MPIAKYSVLKGRATAGKVVSGFSAHYQITIEATDGPFTIAVNIQSVDGSEVLYAVVPSFTPPASLDGVANGMTALKSEPGGLAIDFVRETEDGHPIITHADMALLPIAKDTGSFVAEVESGAGRYSVEHALSNAVVTLLDTAIKDKSNIVYAFGSAYADSGKVDGIHDIHMNQGNPTDNHGSDNGIWQDGALFVYSSMTKTYTAVFIAFQTESWMTDAKGNPASSIG